MKVALLYSGLVRTLELTWPATQRHLGRYQPDVYFYVTEIDRADYVEKLVHPKAMRVEPDVVLPEHDYAQRLGPGIRGLQNDLRQLWGMTQVNQLCRSAGIAYDWVIRIRPDIEITRGPEPLESLDPSFVYIPKVNNWYGYSDRVGFGPQSLMNVYLERYAEFHDFMQNGGIVQMEMNLAYHLRKHRIPVARTCLLSNLLRMNGTRDEPYSSLAWGDVP
jgi:hypothetical protein